MEKGVVNQTDKPPGPSWVSVRSRVRVCRMQCELTYLLVQCLGVYGCMKESLSIRQSWRSGYVLGAAVFCREG